MLDTTLYESLICLAAKALGRSVVTWNRTQGEVIAVLDDQTYWQPIWTNRITSADHDAMQLAAKLNLWMQPLSYLGPVVAGVRQRHRLRAGVGDACLAVVAVNSATPEATQAAIRLAYVVAAASWELAKQQMGSPESGDDAQAQALAAIAHLAPDTGAQCLPASASPQFTDAELTAIYHEANGETDGKARPLSTQAIFRAMRAAVEAAGPPRAEPVSCEPFGFPDYQSCPHS